VAEWASTLRVTLAAGLAALLVACGGPPPPPPDLVIGASERPESVLLANVYAAALRFYGTPVRVEQFDDPLAALDSGSATIVAGLTGGWLQRFAPGSGGRADETVYRQMVGVLPEGIGAGDYTTAAEDKAAAAVTERTATAWGGRELTTALRRCAELRPGAVRGAAVPAKVGRCAPPKPVEFADDAALFDALRTGAINLAWTSTADPGVPADIVLLADEKPALIRAQNVVPLYRRNELGPQQVVALNEVAGVLDTASLKQLRAEVAAGADPRLVADRWLADNPIGATGH